MPNTSNNKITNLPRQTRELSDLLLSVSWDNVNFDDSYFKYSTNIDHSDMLETQKKLVSLILENIPEWERLINCKQHPTHDYDLGIHTLLVIKKIQNDPEYLLLSQYEKMILLYTALLHDIEKVEKQVDPEHPAKGAQTASSILYRLGFEEDFINDVFVLIKNHQLLGLIASNRIKFEICDLVKIFNKPALINLLAILAVADIKSVKKNEGFFSKKIGQNIKQAKLSAMNCYSRNT